MSNSPLPLYRVLIDEYNQQKVGVPMSDDYVRAKRVEFEEFFADIEDREERTKKINSKMCAEFYTWLNDHNVKRSALCFSGGGIRSATFGLGVLQGLARFDLLEKFDYLSTVSGGGYLGGWLSAWIHRQGLRRVQAALRNAPPKSPLQPEPEPIKHLRSYSNYMSPRLGLLSADTWTLVATFFRNLLLNWLVLVPLILAVLMIPRLSIAVASLEPGQWAKQLVFWLAVGSGIFSVAYIYANRPSLADPPSEGSSFPPGKKGQGWFLLYGLTPLLILAILITTYYVWLPFDIDNLGFRFGNFTLPARVAFLILGVALHAGGLLVALRWIKVRRMGFKALVIELTMALMAGGLGGLLTWLAAKNIFPHPGSNTLLPAVVNGSDLITTALYVCFAVPLFLILFLIAVTVFVGLSSYFMTDADREWLARAGAWMLIASAVWAVVHALVIFGPPLLVYGFKTTVSLVSLGAISGFITLVFGGSSQTAPNNESEKKSGVRSILSSMILPLAAAIFTVFILIALSFVTTLMIKGLIGAPWLPGFLATAYRPPAGSVFSDTIVVDTLSLLYNTPILMLLVVMVLLVGFSLVMGRFININKFSLHAAYRDRLIRAYLGASRSSRVRKPNPFTGLDYRDNLQMQELRTGLFTEDSIADSRGLASALRNAADPVSSYIRQGGFLSETTSKLLGIYDAPGTPDKNQEEDLRAGLANDLNLLILGKSIYDKDRFAGLTLTDDIKEILRQDPVVETLRLNRLLLESAYPGTLKSVEMCKPFHVINVTLNLVGGKDLAWQNRKAESFTFSPLHSGSYCVGYRDSYSYSYNANVNRGITLGTAAAISGAAASPNMGYHSSPLVTFLLTLFNVRLGWWLGNPGRAGDDTYNQSGPRFAVRPIVAEALGLTDDRHPYVYVSDGGHFENLGLYEMILRRCQRIVVSDGSADPDYTFEGLGNALSKIRVDFGVPIKFEKILIFPRKHYEKKDHYEQSASVVAAPAGLLTETSPPSATDSLAAPGSPHAPGYGYCAIGRICYSCVDTASTSRVEDGILIYIKASLNGTESADVYNYSKAHQDFPHESTGDQMYSEDQFESYRELGSHILDRICRDLDIEAGGHSLEQLFRHIEHSLGTPPACP